MQRILTFDLSRGFTVLLMPSIHVCMLYSTIPVQQSLLGDMLGFIAEGPGAQLFMLLMGATFTLSKSITKAYVVQRAFYLLLAAYLLNIFKFNIPLELEILPAGLIAEISPTSDLDVYTYFFLIGDILHFAAIAYVLLFIISRFKYYQYIAIVVALGITFISPYVWDQQTGITGLDHLIGLFNAHPPQTFFPVFPWLTYPLIGLAIGYFLKKMHQGPLFRRLGIIGISLIIVSVALPPTPTVTLYLSFYRTEPPDTIFHQGFVLVWLFVVHWISQKIAPNPFFRFLKFCSQNITIIYLTQWILICWCLLFAGYLKLGLLSSIGWMVAITAFTLGFTFLLSKYGRKNI